MRPLTTSTPHALVMIGIPGSGKSTFSSRFADNFSTPLFNLPQISDKLDLNSKQTIKFFETVVREVARTNQNFIIEGLGTTVKERKTLERALARLGYKTLFVWVQTDPAEALKRVSTQSGRSRLSKRQFDNLADDFESPAESEPVVVISGRHAYPAQLKMVLKQLDSSAVKAPARPVKSVDPASQIRVRNTRPDIVTSNPKKR